MDTQQAQKTHKTTTALIMTTTTTTTTQLLRMITTITATTTNTATATATSHTSTCTSFCFLKTQVEKGLCEQQLDKGSAILKDRGVPHTQTLPCVLKESVDFVRQRAGIRQCRIQFTWRQCQSASEAPCHSRCPMRFQLSLKSQRAEFCTLDRTHNRIRSPR